MTQFHASVACGQLDTHIQIDLAISAAFSRIAPSWPLKNWVAVNPLAGFEDLNFDDAIQAGYRYFQQSSIPDPLVAINRESIKWLQAYFEGGQATIRMPYRTLGLYQSWRKLVGYDSRLHSKSPAAQKWLIHLPESPRDAIQDCLKFLDIPEESISEFITILLTTLSGWSSMVKYRTEWCQDQSTHLPDISQVDYVALRLIITRLLWPDAKSILNQSVGIPDLVDACRIAMSLREREFQKSLISQIQLPESRAQKAPNAQFVFCIDVRSEPVRRAIESVGNYETFGMAGFFGVPVQITDSVTGHGYSACPVIVSPAHAVLQVPDGHNWLTEVKGYARLMIGKRLYQSLKYTFTAPFALVEAMGLPGGLWMAIRSLFPNFAFKLAKMTRKALYNPHHHLNLDGIPISVQCEFAYRVIQTLGITKFSPMIIFVGHNGQTENNAYASALHCGACGGNAGRPNAQTIAKILNTPSVRDALVPLGVHIPETTVFLSGCHVTTSGELQVDYDPIHEAKMAPIIRDLVAVRSQVSVEQAVQLGFRGDPNDAGHYIITRSHDWAQVRPEWGLARNAGIVVGPRRATACKDLNGRCFLQSYESEIDTDGTILSQIFSGPVMVAHWICSQYLFSTIDNVAFGGGNKITKNVTGKMGIMQGNASDLMPGLPLQSVYATDTDPFHIPQRLLVVVVAPPERINQAVAHCPAIQKLVINQWVHLVSVIPGGSTSQLLPDLTWVNRQAPGLPF